MTTPWEAVIGLEVHVQLRTRTKLFCGCSTAFAAPPNTCCCPVCLGHPGVLPVMNERALELAVRFGVALGAEVPDRSSFARKNYFYPDLPKGYQVTQFDEPVVLGGQVEIDGEDGEPRVIRLTRAHLEEDAGKSTHLATGVSMVDCNRAGVPLLEVVSEPDLRSATDASAYLKELRNIVRYLDISDGHMEQGSFRCDANVSLRRQGTEELGTRVEIKNLNSFNHVKRALEFEIERQAAALDGGEPVVQETRLWDEACGRTRTMRFKEEAHDYRYFPEPDLRPLVVPAAMRASARASLPELPRARRARYEAELGLERYDASVLTAEQALGDYFELVLASGGPGLAKTAANWVMGELRGRLNADGRAIGDSPVGPDALATILGRVADGRLSGKLAKQVFGRVYAGEALDAVLADVGEQVTDSGAIAAEVAKVLDAHPDKVAAYRGGKTKLLGFFIGQVMRATKGKANPQAVRESTLAELEAK